MARIEFVPYPPTSFPFRDLLVLEQAPLGPERRLCEIGVGAGGTTARLARLCGRVTGFEISRPALAALAALPRRYRNLELVAADVTDSGALAGHAGEYDTAVSCDTLEHVVDPAGFFRGLATLVAPGGRILVTFPNEPRERMHGITRFDSREELAALVAAAGFEELRIGAARLTPWAARTARLLGWTPLAAARRVLAATRRIAAPLRRRARPPRAEEPPPQTFEQTRFFRDLALWNLLAPAINLYWYLVLRAMAAAGPAFTFDWEFRDAPFTACQVVVAARRASTAAAAA